MIWGKMTPCCFLLLSIIIILVHGSDIDINVNNLGRTFDGIGAISGGGATSKLLRSYNVTVRDEILDYLFKPGYGASLHMLKVEMGGDMQSTEGTEGSHMHTPWDEDYNRGYEWWMMEEAKKRNPNIKLLGLPWGFPGWVGQGTGSPWSNVSVTAIYVTKWILGAKKYHNLTIDYMGIWNEKPYNIEYVKTLRNLLNEVGLKNVKLVVGDGTWAPAIDAATDSSFANAFDVIGVHYPGTVSSEEAKQIGKHLWSSEDYSTVSNDVGSGCWARILNQNYVNGLMTSTIAWNLITSYYDNLPFPRASLMTANQPWSGHFEIPGPLWVTAHMTHFTKPGWTYLAHGSGVGLLTKGGSYVSLVSPDKKNITIIIETMTRQQSLCVRPFLWPYTVADLQTVEIDLSKFSESIEEMRFYISNITSNGTSSYFRRQTDLKISDKKVILTIKKDSLITLTSLPASKPPKTTGSPAKSSFPLPFVDNFESAVYESTSEPEYITSQVGYFEVVSDPITKNSKALLQIVPDVPVHWCPITLSSPFAVVGPGDWETVNASISVLIPDVNATTGAFLAVRADQGGCTSFMTKGVFVWLLKSSNQLAITNDLVRTMLVFSTPMTVLPNRYYRINIVDKGSIIDISVDGKKITSIQPTKLTPKKGFVGMGTDSFGKAFFDDLNLQKVGKDSTLRFLSRA